MSAGSIFQQTPFGKYRQESFDKKSTRHPSIREISPVRTQRKTSARHQVRDDYSPEGYRQPERKNKNKKSKKENKVKKEKTQKEKDEDFQREKQKKLDDFDSGRTGGNTGGNTGAPQTQEQRDIEMMIEMSLKTKEASDKKTKIAKDTSALK